MRLASLVALLTLALDQGTKLTVVHGLDLAGRGEIEVLPPWLTFRMAWNYGINFGLLAGHSDLTRWALIAIALAVSAWVWLWVRRGEKAGGPVGRAAQAAAGLLVGGALGNVVDRLRYGAVADFINTSCCGIENPYAYNLADIAIFGGVLGLLLFTGGPKSRPSNRCKDGDRGGKTP